MFGLFKSATVDDPQFGQLTYTKGFWRGQLTFANDTRVPLALTGDKQGPSDAARAAAQRVVADYAAWQPFIAAALREHAAPYADEAGLDHSTDAKVWAGVTLQYVAIDTQRGTLTTELGFAAEWDEEHMLGARFHDGHLVELNGSVVAP